MKQYTVKGVLSYLRSRAGRVRRILTSSPGHYLQEFLPLRAFLGDFSFVQIGAFDGVTNDPLFHWVNKYGWKGVLCEPQQFFFEKLIRNYGSNPNVKFANVAIAATSGKRTFYSIKSAPGDVLPAWAPQICSLDLKTLMRHEEIFPALKRNVQASEIECITLADLQTRFALRHIDFLQIDAEGYDFEIIKSIDFSKNAPLLVQFEAVHLSTDDLNQCQRLLDAAGYELFPKGLDILAVYRPTKRRVLTPLTFSHPMFKKGGVKTADPDSVGMAR